MTAAELVFGQMDAMRQHGAPANQPVMIVNVEIVLALRKQLGGPCDLVAVLRDMRVHEHIRMLAPEAACGLELRRSAGTGEARRDRIEAAAAAMPACDQRPGVIVSLLRGVAQF